MQLRCTTLCRHSCYRTKRRNSTERVSSISLCHSKNSGTRQRIQFPVTKMSGPMLMSLKIDHKISNDLQWLQLKLRGLWYLRLEHDVPQAIMDVGFGLLFYLKSCKVGVKGNLANDYYKKFPSLIFKHWRKSLFFGGLCLQPLSTQPGRCVSLQWLGDSIRGSLLTTHHAPPDAGESRHGRRWASK